MSENTALEIDGLTIDYPLSSGTVSAVSNLTLRMRRGERLGLVGESGSGKTTAALALMGMLREPGRVVAGSARLNGVDLVSLDQESHAKIRLRELSYVPQGAMNSLNPVMRIRASIAHALVDHSYTDSKNDLDLKIDDLLLSVGLDPKVGNAYPHELSGGMKQRVCIAIAISLGPKLIIADEPTSALDAVTQRVIMRTLSEAQERVGSAMILIGHDMGLMAQSVDSVAVMKEGRLVELAPTRDIFRTQKDSYTTKLITSIPNLGGVRRPTQTKDSIPANDPFVELREVSMSYDGGLFRRSEEPALRPISLRLPDAVPHILAVVGQSGSGKTTLGNILLGDLKPTSGRILYRGRAATELDRRLRRQVSREVQAIFQDPYSAFNPFYRVERSIVRPLVNFGIARDQNHGREIAERACEQVGLRSRQILDRFVHQLSGGQRQRLMIARALAMTPALLVADEPVSMVDASMRATILDDIVALRDRLRIPIVYITHDLATAYRIADEVIVMNRGRVVEAGAPDEVLLKPQHPYTKLLLACLPWPDPERAWSERATEERLMSQIRDRMDDGPIVRPGATSFRFNAQPPKE